MHFRQLAEDRTPALLALPPSASRFGWLAVAVDPDSDEIHIAPRFPGLAVLRRGTGSGADIAVPFDRYGSVGVSWDMHFSPVPEPTLGALQLAALCALLARARRSRTRRD